MIYLFYGDDNKNKRQNFEKFLKSISQSEVLHLNKNNFNKMELESLYSGAGLFFSKAVVVGDGLLEYEDHARFIIDRLPFLARSSNDFIFLEGKLNKSELEPFIQNQAKISVFELPKAKKEKFDNFLVANAFSAKDKLNMWVYFRQAMDLGVGMEEIIGVLFWKVKDMLLKRDFRKFSEAELKNISARLSYLLPEARQSGLDAESAFEQFILEVF